MASRRMPFATLCLLLALIPSPGFTVEPELFPLAELRPGLRGEALTVFAGDSISRFEVEILDRVPGQAPFDLVLIRCHGEDLERAGVSLGMSGSPVYVDGRLLGAIAFNFSWSREPLALVTPAAAMLALADRPGGERAELGGALRGLPFIDGMPAGTETDFAGQPLVLSVGGVPPAALSAMDGRYRPLGFQLLPMGRLDAEAGGAVTSLDALRPGAALAVELLRGPISAASIGTLTHRDGDRVWALGHPFLGEGPVALPMAGARIHGVMPSLMNSFKLGSVGSPLGTILQDGQSGVFGRLGDSPAMLPLDLVLRGVAEEPLRAGFELARHRRLMPALARMALDGWLPGRLGPRQEGGFTLRLRLRPSEGEVVTLTQRFSGEGSVQAPATWIQSLLQAVQANPAGPLPLDSLAVELDWRAGEEAVVLADLALVSDAVAAGESWRLRLKLRQGDASRVRELRFPSRGESGLVGLAEGSFLPPGAYTLHVADGASFDRWNATRRPALYRFEDHAQLMDLLGRLESNANWVAWLEAPGESSVAGGREFQMPTWFRELAPRSRRGPIETPKKARRLLAQRREAAAGEAALSGHLALPVTIIAQPSRGKAPRSN